MLAIIKKELRLFFGSLGGYLIIAGFLSLNGLWLWFLKSDANILNSGFADLSHFFQSTAWLFILVIPALTMKIFSEEVQSGTIEILKTKPITDLQIVSGKFLSILSIITIMLLPTLVYVFSLYQLAVPVGNIETGSLVGSYIGLLFLASAFIAIGSWISATTKNSLLALLASVVLSFFLYEGLTEFSVILEGFEIEKLCLSNHFSSISRGVIDTRDLLFFSFVSLLFLSFTHYCVSLKKNKKTLLYTVVFICIVGAISNKYHLRLDLTSDKKYSLSEASITILAKLDETAVIKVYLEGDFPAEFKRLQSETKQVLEEIKAINKNLKVLFVNPKNQIQELIKKGLTPSRLTIEESGTITESVIIPWATISYKNKKENISLLKNSAPQETQRQQLEKSVQNLEYTFINALKKVTSKKEKSIVILTGNGELEDIYLYSLLDGVKKNYHLAKFTLDSIETNALKTIEHLNSFDLAIIAKPTIAFTEREKYALDQYILNGGKSLWMIDNVHAEMDSLFSNGKTLAYSRDLNLDDFFFRYGARINKNLVKDLYASKIAVATGNTGNKTNFENFLWFYAPLVDPTEAHPIINNLSQVSLSFVSTIDTLRNAIKKTILLKSSLLSKEVRMPSIIELNSIIEKPDPKAYNRGNKTLAVLLEGSFTSAYKDRVKPIKIKNPKELGVPNKMILIADGDIAKNQIHKGKPIALGMDKWTNAYYENKEFLLNAIEYLLDDTGLIAVRSKKISIKTLDKNKVIDHTLYWKLLNLILPLFVVVFFGTLYYYVKKNKFSKPFI